MFQAYCENPEFTPSLEFPKNCWNFLGRETWKEWNKVNNNKLGYVLLLHLKKIGKVLFVSGAGVSALLALVQVFYGLKGAERQKYFQAWQVIVTAKDQPGNGGRNEALEYLNKENNFFYTPKCKGDNNCLVGIKIQGANLKNVDLAGANLESSEFRGTNFEGAVLRDVSFKNAHLEGAVFTSATVKGINFTGAKFCKTIMEDGTEKNDSCKTGKK
jgi:hypothetical protein